MVSENKPDATSNIEILTLQKLFFISIKILIANNITAELWTLIAYKYPAQQNIRFFSFILSVTKQKMQRLYEIAPLIPAAKSKKGSIAQI